MNEVRINFNLTKSEKGVKPIKSEIKTWVKYIFDDNQPMQCNKGVKKRAEEFASNYKKYVAKEKYNMHNAKCYRKQLSRTNNKYSYNYRLFSMV